MRMRVKYSDIFFGLILTIIIIDCDFFRLFKIGDDIYKAVNLLIVGVILFICIIHKNIFIVSKKCGKFIYFYIGLISSYMIFEYIYTMHIYEGLQTFYEFAKYNKHYVFIFLIIPLTYIFMVKNEFIDVMNGVLIVVTITLGLILLHAIMYNWQEVELLNISIYAKRLTRNDRMRMWDLSSLEGLAIIYATYRFLCDKKKKILYFVSAFICLMALVYVEQTRMMLIAVAVSLVSMIVIKPSRTSGEILMKVVLISLIGIIAGFIILPKLFTSFNGGYSISYRLIEMQFAVNILRTHGIFGMGTISYNIQKYLYYYGIYSSISLNDIGIVGDVAQAGIWSIGLFIVPMLRMAWILLNGKKDDVQIFLWAIYVYLLVTSVTLFVLNSKRILMWPFCLALFEFYHKQSIQEKKIINT